MGYFIGSKCKWCKQNPVRLGSPYCSKKCETEAKGKNNNSNESQDSGVIGDLVYFVCIGFWLMMGKLILGMIKHTYNLAIKFYKWNPKVAIASAIIFSILTAINSACENEKKDTLNKKVNESFLSDTNSAQRIFVDAYTRFVEENKNESEAVRLAKSEIELEKPFKNLFNNKEEIVVTIESIQVSRDNKVAYLTATIPETNIKISTPEKSILYQTDYGIPSNSNFFNETLLLKKSDIVSITPEIVTNYEDVKNSIKYNNKEINIKVKIISLKKLINK